MIAASLLFVACSSTRVSDRVSEFSAEYPKNYIVVHDGAPSDFYKARCYQFDVVEDLSTPSVRTRLKNILRERLPQLPACTTSWPRVVIEFHAGRGVSMHHAKPDDTQPYSAFALIVFGNSPAELEVPDANGAYRALAEWQYWRGGSSELVLEQVVFDFTNLFINGLVKPVPGDAPN
jgi:hypothetical protein